MTEKDCIESLRSCKPLAQCLIEVFELEDHSLSRAQMKIMKSFFRLRACKSYNQLKFLSAQAKISADQFDCLEEMYTEMMLRFLKGTNMQTSRKLTIIGRWLQWLDGKINWKIKVPVNINIYHKHF